MGSLECRGKTQLPSLWNSVSLKKEKEREQACGKSSPDCDVECWPVLFHRLWQAETQRHSLDVV